MTMNPPDTSPWVRALPGTTHVVLDSPHSGTRYDLPFGHACAPELLRDAEDTHVEKLYSFAADAGCAWVEALFPRSYLDANRNTDEIDPTMLADPWPDEVNSNAKVRLGKGLIWKQLDDGTPIYDRALSAVEVRQRIAQCWVPYHRAVKTAIDAAHAAHGQCIHINCHSMPAVGGHFATEHPGLKHADFVLGNRDDTTASPALMQRMADVLKSQGHSVAVNHPYKGVELVRRYGNPAQHRHSVQLEINRGLYMNEASREMTAGFGALQNLLQQLVQELLKTDVRALSR